MGDLETCCEKLGCWAGFYFGFLKRKCRAGVLGSGFPACNYVDLWCSSSLVLELLLHLPGFSSPAPVPGQGWGSCRAKSTRGRDVGFQASHGQEPFPSEPRGPAVGLGAPRRRAPSRETPCAPTVLEGQWGNFVLYFFPTFMLVFVLFFCFHLQGERPWRGAGTCRRAGVGSSALGPGGCWKAGLILVFPREAGAVCVCLSAGAGPLAPPAIQFRWDHFRCI